MNEEYEYRVLYSFRTGERCELIYTPKVFDDPFHEAFLAYKRAWVRAAKGEIMNEDYNHPTLTKRPVPQPWEKVELP